MGSPFGVSWSLLGVRRLRDAELIGLPTDEFSALLRSNLGMAAPAPHTVVFAIDDPIARTDLPRLCERIAALLEKTGAEVALCDVSAVEPDAVSVDALARLQLIARRRGCQARLRGASNELLELLAFIGLGDVLPDGP